MKRVLPLLCLLAALCLAVTAMASPIVSNGSYTAYLGDSNYLYLEDAEGAAKVLRSPIIDLIGMDDSQLYCLASGGALYAIRLDGTSTSIVSNAPSESDLESAAGVLPYALEDAALSLRRTDGSTAPLSTSALMACTNGTQLFYIEQGTDGQTTLMSVALTSETGLTAAPISLGNGIDSPLFMAASQDAVTMLGSDHTVTVVTLADNEYHTLAAASVNTAAAVCHNGQVYRYTQDLSGHYLIESVSPLDNMTFATARTAETASPAPAVTATPTATQRPTSTPAPTKTPRPSSGSSNSSSSDDGRISKGARGSSVRKMQNRLAELGYPVGKVDGVFGNDTLLAVHLFQCAINYTERSYASASMLKKLYAKDAPVYDPYAPLKNGDKGTDVLLMQTRLHDLGYDPGKLDGKYGPNTVAAVAQFQSVALLVVTGDADQNTLIALFDPDAPVNSGTATPIPPTDAPTPPPTDAPTTAPTDAPTTAPTTAPTDAPTTAPTDAPTTAPTDAPTTAPTDAPTDPATSSDLQ